MNVRRLSLALAAASGLAGCAVAPPAPVAAPRAPGAAALAFTPPVALGLPPLDLARQDRAAFVGFEAPVASFTHVRIDDRQTGDDREFYERRAIVHHASGVRR